MGDSVQVSSVESFGFTVKGDYTTRPDSLNADNIIIDFKGGVSVSLPRQNMEGASVSCTLRKDDIFITAKKLNGAIIYGSKGNDVILSNGCQNCIFNVANDGDNRDILYLYNEETYRGNNRLLLGKNDRGYYQHLQDGKVVRGAIDTSKKVQNKKGQ